VQGAERLAACESAKPCAQLAAQALEVSFIEPAGLYQRLERASKYGFLFIGLTFAAFFLLELLRRLAIHPVQYALVGLALAMFFLALAALSEHLDFALVGDRLARQHAHRRRLARAVGPEQADARARWYVEVEPGDSGDLAVVLDDTVQSDCEIAVQVIGGRVLRSHFVFNAAQPASIPVSWSLRPSWEPKIISRLSRLQAAFGPSRIRGGLRVSERSTIAVSNRPEAGRTRCTCRGSS